MQAFNLKAALESMLWLLLRISWAINTLPLKVKGDKFIGRKAKKKVYKTVLTVCVSSKLYVTTFWTITNSQHLLISYSSAMFGRNCKQIEQLKTFD